MARPKKNESTALTPVVMSKVIPEDKDLDDLAGTIVSDMNKKEGLGTIEDTDVKDWISIAGSEQMDYIISNRHPGGVPQGRIIEFQGPACHGKGDKVLLHDGTPINVENVVVGQSLLGPDGLPRKVLKVHSGIDELYSLKSHRGGKTYTVNGNHILVLKRASGTTKIPRTETGLTRTKAGEVKTITVNNYLATSKTSKKYYRQQKCGITEFKTSQNVRHPYILGLLIGDGSLAINRIELTTADPEIAESYVNFCTYNFGYSVSKHHKKDNKAFGLYHLNNGEVDQIRNWLSGLNLVGKTSGTKFIPNEYKFANAEARKELLAGLLDTDGHYSGGVFEYTTKSTQLAEDVAFIANSLGLFATISNKYNKRYDTNYQRVVICGDVCTIPTRVKRKQAPQKRHFANSLLSGFSLTPKGLGEYFGFELDGDHLYLTDDFTIFHNSIGKSHIMYELAKGCQSKGGLVFYFDSEFSINKDYVVETFGLNPNRFKVIPKRCMEEVFESTEYIINIARSKMAKNVPILIVWDSLAAMTPKEELEGAYDKNTIGLAARVVSKGLRKIVGVISSMNVTLVIVNQQRMKIGVCMSGDTKVCLADGTRKTIKSIVKNKEQTKVLSYNAQTNQIEPKNIVNWFDNGVSIEPLVKVRVLGGKNGKDTFNATKDHIVFTSNGSKRVGELCVGDKILKSDRKLFTDQQMELILGMQLGDGSIRFEKNGWKGYVRLAHSPKQKEYCAWKAQQLGYEINTSSQGIPWFESDRTAQLRKFKSITKRKGLITVEQNIIEELTPKAVAIWYQDDGTYSGSHEQWGWGKCQLSAKIMASECLERFASKFESLGLGRPTIRVGKGFSWSGQQSELFQKGIAKYIHPSMRYKTKLTEEFDFQIESFKEPQFGVYEADIISIEEYKPTRKYDLEVEDNHTYLVGDNNIVHNCYGDPTTTPCGNAMLYYASTRIKLGAGSPIKQTINGKECVIGINVTAKTIKNKVANPFRSVEFEIHFGRGIVEHEQVFDYLREWCANNDKNPVILNGHKIEVAGTGAWKTFTISDEKTNAIVKEIKCYKAEFGEKVLYNPEVKDYVRALMDAAYIMQGTTHATFAGADLSDPDQLKETKRRSEEPPEE